MTDTNFYRVRVHGDPRRTVDTTDYTVAFDRRLTTEQLHALRDTILLFRATDPNTGGRKWRVRDGMFRALAQFEETQGVHGEIRSDPVVDVVEIF